MCGILLVATRGEHCGHPEASSAAAPDAAAFAGALHARGPDHTGHAEVHAGEQLHLALSASLLQLRGTHPSTSPLMAPDGSVLCFNGEVFGGLEVPPGANDAQALLAALQAAGGDLGALVALLSSVRGPWALMYWHGPSQQLLFGRDVLGRRSLLLHEPTASDPRLLLSSISHTTQSCMPACTGPAVGSNGHMNACTADGSSTEGVSANIGIGPSTNGSSSSSSGYWMELPPGLYSISAQGLQQLLESAASTNAGACSFLPACAQHPWQDPQLLELQAYSRPAALIMPPEEGPGGCRAGGTGNNGAARGGVPGSGEEADPQQQQQPPPEQQHEAARLQVSEHADTSSSSQPCESQPWPVLQEAAAQLLDMLQHAVQVRCCCVDQHTQRPGAAPPQPGGSNLPDQLQEQQRGQQQPPQPPLLTQQEQEQQQQQQQPLLILFSGGVDSMLLAALADRALPPSVPIELSNVCFDAGRSPDRLAARAGLEELARLAPGREWRLIEVDASLADVDAARAHLLELLEPAATVMDLNIGAALWLAARAAGVLRLPQRQQKLNGAATATGSGSGVVSGAQPAATAAGPAPAAAAQCMKQPAAPAVAQVYTSAARVALLGHGADEQFGGYGRHRTSLRLGGWQGLADEMALDVSRLWVRNLGRDDRLIADHGREGRHPFLDESLMTWALRMPLWLLTDLRQGPGVGDKHVLREALRQLGLPEAARRDKRAIQFGSRIGRLTNVRDFGSSRAANKVNAGSVALAQVPAGSAGRAAQ